MKPSAQYRRDADALRRFREAYVALVNASRPHQPMFITQLGPGVPQEQWNQLRTEVSVAAGRAEPAYSRHGGVFALRNAAYAMSGLSPVVNWEMSLRDPDQLPPQTVVSAVESAIGLAETRSAEAEEREKGLSASSQPSCGGRRRYGKRLDLATRHNAGPLVRSAS